MMRYYFNLRYGPGPDKLAVDPEGDDLASLDQAHERALHVAQDLIAHTRSEMVRDWFECQFEVEDEAGQAVLTVPFAETVGPDAHRRFVPD